MKIRNGFVSNSSSSSFIVELPKPITQYSLEQFQELINNKTRYSETLYKDLKNNDKEDVWGYEYNYDFYINLPDTIQEILGDNYDSFIEECKVSIKNKFDKKYLSKNTYSVQYGDDDGEYFSVMEHDFMPSLNITKNRINHH